MCRLSYFKQPNATVRDLTFVRYRIVASVNYMSMHHDDWGLGMVGGGGGGWYRRNKMINAMIRKMMREMSNCLWGTKFRFLAGNYAY